MVLSFISWESSKVSDSDDIFCVFIVVVWTSLFSELELLIDTILGVNRNTCVLKAKLFRNNTDTDVTGCKKKRKWFLTV